MTGKMMMNELMTNIGTESQSMNSSTASLLELFSRQKGNQLEMLRRGMYDQYVDWVTKHDKDLPIDHPQLASYHIQQLVSEIGEVLEADKRWKNIRNNKYDKESKLDEIADCFIVLMNITMYSGFNGEDLFNAIKHKIQVVSDRINKEN